MIKTPPDLKYTKTHEWARAEPDGTVAVGITDFAQEALGDIVFVEFPKVGARILLPTISSPISTPPHMNTTA